MFIYERHEIMKYIVGDVNVHASVHAVQLQFHGHTHSQYKAEYEFVTVYIHVHRTEFECTHKFAPLTFIHFNTYLYTNRLPSLLSRKSS